MSYNLSNGGQSYRVRQKLAVCKVGNNADEKLLADEKLAKLFKQWLAAFEAVEAAILGPKKTLEVPVEDRQPRDKPE